MNSLIWIHVTDMFMCISYETQPHSSQVMVWLETMMCLHRQNVLSVIGLLLIIECIISLKLLELRVPAHVPLGTRAALSCRWQLGAHDVLYSVKWYKDGKEFFRHVPRDLEPRRKFPLPGVDVEMYDSSGGNLTLTPAVLETSGRYRCEVSGEKPLFPTVSDHADLMVVVLPAHGPIISGLHSRYRPGDHVQVNCTSGPSRPTTKLAWYINGEQAPLQTLLPPVFDEENGLETTTLMLDFVVTERDFRKSGFKVKCLATLPPLYWRSNEESALKERTTHDQMTRTGDIRVSRADRVSANHADELSSNWIVYAALVCSLIKT